ncbi:MAG: DNA cytosine methyltransferase, partial [Bradyrhizobium sp.]|nr:DNA cytosine methyltransferase [Bradyrhizobium sp.]
MTSPVRVVSLFAGCGNADGVVHEAAQELGVDLEVVAAFDSWPKAVEVYNANLPHPVAQVRDLKAMQRVEILALRPDLIIGGPPCQDHSTARKQSCRCTEPGGYIAPRCCLLDFERLVGLRTDCVTPFVMENVRPRLINAGWSEKLCAADFGDVTNRKRWFYSNYLLHVIPTPGPLRIRDIRDHDEDARILAKRRGCKAGAHNHYGGSLTADVPRAHSGEVLAIGLRGNSATATVF